MQTLMALILGLTSTPLLIPMTAGKVHYANSLSKCNLLKDNASLAQVGLRAGQENSILMLPTN